jgi:hypothetical protein
MPIDMNHTRWICCTGKAIQAKAAVSRARLLTGRHNLQAILELKISIVEKKGDNIEKYVENKLHIKI